MDFHCEQEGIEGHDPGETRGLLAHASQKLVPHQLIICHHLGLACPVGGEEKGGGERITGGGAS